MKAIVQDIWINRVGLFAIVVLSLGYVLFGSSFAQLRLEFSFLNFPIFIGEILLVVASLLLIVKCAWQKQELGRWGWVLTAYLIFVLLKACLGYFKWGPLALRDAALFYYLFYAVLGYSFWSHDLWGDKIRRLFIAVILSIFILHQFVAFWPCTLIILGIILALQAKNSLERIVLIGAFFIFAPYGTLFNVCFRTVILSSLVTVIFLGVIAFFLFCRNPKVRIIGGVLICFVLGIALFKASETGLGKTFFIKDAKPLVTVVPQEIPQGKCLFHSVGNSPEKPDSMKEFVQRMRDEYFFKKKCSMHLQEKSPVHMQEKCPVQTKSTYEYSNEMLGVKQDDTRFRYYIWMDMAHEYAHHKPIFGFAFGRPLCSTTISKYFGTSSTQYTDGWVGAHNSFFYMIYRAGIVGLAMVVFIYWLWFGLVRDFYILRDWTGILLCSILLNWFVAANFFLIFELPYTAIPVWTILGITLKHRMLLRK